MPRKPRVTHPLRDIRHALNMTQQAFAKFVGCSAIAIQRIENRSMKKMSREMADRILEATGANPFELLAGRKAVDVKGQPYSKQSFDEYQSWLKTNLYDRQYYHGHLARYLELLLIASERAGQLKLHCVNAALQHSFARIGEDFGLKNNIHGHLIEQGKIRKRVYLVRDLRKDPYCQKKSKGNSQIKITASTATAPRPTHPNTKQPPKRFQRLFIGESRNIDRKSTRLNSSHLGIS